MKWRIEDDKRLEKIIEFAPKTNGKILDIGTKYGFTIQKYGKGIGLDKSKEFLKKCKIKYKILANCYYLPFKNRTFDLIFLTEVIEHLDNPEKCIEEISRVSKGRIIVTTPTNSFLRKIKRFLQRKPNILSQDHIREFSLLDVIKMFKKYGFKVSKYTGIGFFLSSRPEYIMDKLGKLFPANSSDMLIEFEKEVK